MHQDELCYKFFLLPKDVLCALGFLKGQDAAELEGVSPGTCFLCELPHCRDCGVGHRAHVGWKCADFKNLMEISVPKWRDQWQTENAMQAGDEYVDPVLLNMLDLAHIEADKKRRVPNRAYGSTNGWCLCPTCKRVIYKQGGCDDMVCGRDYDGAGASLRSGGCGRRFRWDEQPPPATEPLPRRYLAKADQVLNPPKGHLNPLHALYKAEENRNGPGNVRESLVFVSER